MTRRPLCLVSLVLLAGCGSVPNQPADDRPAVAPVGPAGDVVASAELALGGTVGADSWRPALRADLERFLQDMGALPPGKAPSPVRTLLDDLDALQDVRRAEPTTRAEDLVLVGPMALATRAQGTFVVCREAEFDTLDDSVVVCLGDLRARTARNSVLFVLGRTEVDEIDATTLCGAGPLDARLTRDTQILVVGGPARSSP